MLTLLNVECSLLQFLHTTGQEQAQLVPVITSLLKLSQQERVFLEEVLKGVHDHIGTTLYLSIVYHSCCIQQQPP